MLKLGVYFLIMWSFKLWDFVMWYCASAEHSLTLWYALFQLDQVHVATVDNVHTAVCAWQLSCEGYDIPCTWYQLVFGDIWSAVTCQVVCVRTLCCTSPICFGHAYWITCLLQSVVVLSDDMKQVFQALGYSDSNLCNSFCRHVPVEVGKNKGRSRTPIKLFHLKILNSFSSLEIFSHLECPMNANEMKGLCCIETGIVVRV